MSRIDADAAIIAELAKYIGDKQACRIKGGSLLTTIGMWCPSKPSCASLTHIRCITLIVSVVGFAVVGVVKIATTLRENQSAIQSAISETYEDYSKSVTMNKEMNLATDFALGEKSAPEKSWEDIKTNFQSALDSLGITDVTERKQLMHALELLKQKVLDFKSNISLGNGKSLAVTSAVGLRALYDSLYAKVYEITCKSKGGSRRRKSKRSRRRKSKRSRRQMYPR